MPELRSTSGRIGATQASNTAPTLPSCTHLRGAMHEKAEEGEANVERALRSCRAPAPLALSGGICSLVDPACSRRVLCICHIAAACCCCTCQPAPAAGWLAARGFGWLAARAFRGHLVGRVMCI